MARILIFAFLLIFFVQSISSNEVNGWQPLAPGMDIQILKASKSSSVGDSKITLLRIDPNMWELVFLGISQTVETAGKTAREWCKSQKLTAAINAWMYATDYKTHIGYLKSRDHINNSHLINEYMVNYKSS